MLVGVIAGLLGSFFRVVLDQFDRHRLAFLESLPITSRVPTAVLIGAVGGGLGVWLVRRWAPEASGSGIPHLKSVTLGETTINWRRLIPVKFLGGLAAVGGGLTLGREGPTIQIGGATGAMVAEGFRVKPGEGERRALVSAGAGGGLAAAFNAPLAGVMFVLEELQGSFTPVVFVAAFLAAVSADIVGRVLTGEMPVFALKFLVAPTLAALPVALLLGVLAGFGGVVFNRCLLSSLDVADRLKHWPSWLLGASAGAIVGLVSGFVPGVGGAGGSLVERALAGEVAWRWLPWFFLVRFGLLLVSYGSGAAGGFFAPLLVLGAFGGLAVGGATHHFAPAFAPHPEIFAVLGMGALLTAAVRAPLTAIVLMVELTGKYDFMLPLLVSCLAAYGVAEMMRDEPIYEALRLRGRSRHRIAAEPA